MGRTGAVVILLVAVLLGGCFQSDGPDPEPTPSAPAEESDDGYGTLRGTIVTIHLDPIKDARVQVIEGDRTVAETSTLENGRYSITNIEPGQYRVHVTAACCREHAQGLVVEADEVYEVHLQLEVYTEDDLQRAYVEQYQWTGFLECSLAYVGDEINVCGIAGIVPGMLGFNVTDDDFLHRFEVRPGIKSVVGAMHWANPAPGSGDELSLFFEVSGMPNNGEDTPDADPSYARVSGVSPLEFRADAGDLVDYYDEGAHAFDFENLEAALEVMFRVFASGTVNVVYQQQFSVDWDIYYWEGAPEGATALADS